MAILLSANYFSIMTDLDWSWQIRTGELIVQTGNLRPPEAFSYTIHGQPVHDFEWLYEVSLYYVWSFLGGGGLKFIKMVLVTIPLVLLGWRLRCQGVRWHAIAVSLYVAVWIISTVWNLRALYCTTIGLLLVSGWLHDHCVGRKPLTWWLPVAMLLWSNLHPGVITGQGLLLGAIGIEWASRCLKSLNLEKNTFPMLLHLAIPLVCGLAFWVWLTPSLHAGWAWLKDDVASDLTLSDWLDMVPGWTVTTVGVAGSVLLGCFAIGPVRVFAFRWLIDSPLDWSQLKRLTLIGGLGFLATFASPDPIDRLLYPFRPELKHPVQNRFTEMKSLYSFLGSMPLVVEATYVLAGCVLITLVFRSRQYRIWELFLLAGLALLGNLAVRCLMDWTLIMLALAVPKMGNLLLATAQANPRRLITRLCLKCDSFCRRLMDSRFFCFQPAWLLTMVGVFLIISLIPPLANRLPVQESSDWPVAPMEFAAQEGLHGNFFSTPDHGAWIGWRLKEKGLIYTDTRGFFFPRI